MKRQAFILNREAGAIFKKETLELQNTIYENQNSLDRLKSRMKMTEKIGNLKTYQKKVHKLRMEKKNF